MKKLHLFNLRKENWELRDYPLPNTHSSKHSDSAEAPLDDDEHMTQASDEWGGPMARREIQAIYLIAFFCLLRSDEVLKIRREHLILSKDGQTVTVMLPFRKMHKNGGGCSSVPLPPIILSFLIDILRNQALCVTHVA